MAQREQIRTGERGVLAHFGHMDEEPMTITEGDGAYVRTDDDEEYLDFTSQLYCVNAGHSNDAITDAMAEQLDRIQYVSSAKDNDARSQLADTLTEVAPQPLTDVFFSISGSESNEAAIQIAREFQDASTVLTRWRSYHGGTYATAGITGDPAIRLPVESHAATTGNVKFLPPFGVPMPPSTPTRPRSSPSDRSPTSNTSSATRDRIRSPRSSPRSSADRAGRSPHRRATSRACASSVTSTTSC